MNVCMYFQMFNISLAIYNIYKVKVFACALCKSTVLNLEPQWHLTPRRHTKS